MLLLNLFSFSRYRLCQRGKKNEGMSPEKCEYNVSSKNKNEKRSTYEISYKGFNIVRDKMNIET